MGEKAKGPNKYELFGPFYTSTEVVVQEKFYCLRNRLRKGFGKHSSGSTTSSTEGRWFSTSCPNLFTALYTDSRPACGEHSLVDTRQGRGWRRLPERRRHVDGTRGS